MEELIRIEHELPYLQAEAMTELIENEKALKSLKERQDALKAALLSEMESKNIKKIETPFITISRIDATDRETFNTKLFRADHADLYDEYIEITTVKPSIRVNVK